LVSRMEDNVGYNLQVVWEKANVVRKDTTNTTRYTSKSSIRIISRVLLTR